MSRPYRSPATPDRRAQIVISTARQTLERNCGTVEPHLVEALKRVAASEVDADTKAEALALLEEAQQ